MIKQTFDSQDTRSGDRRVGPRIHRKTVEKPETTHAAKSKWRAVVC